MIVSSNNNINNNRSRIHINSRRSISPNNNKNRILELSKNNINVFLEKF